MFVNKMARYELLSPDAVEVLDRGWRRIVSEIGVQFVKPEAVELFRQAGQKVEDQTVWLDPEFVLEQVAKAPTSSTCRPATLRTQSTSGRPHGLRRGVRAAVRQGRRRPPGCHDDRLPQVLHARPELPRARLGRGRDLRAERRPARTRATST